MRARRCGRRRARRARGGRGARAARGAVRWRRKRCGPPPALGAFGSFWEAEKSCKSRGWGFAGNTESGANSRILYKLALKGGQNEKLGVYGCWGAVNF